MKYFPSQLIKKDDIALPIIKHSNQANEPSYIVVARMGAIENIIEKIESGLIKGLISSQEILKRFEKYKNKVDLVPCENPSLFWAETCYANYSKMPQNCIVVTGTNGKTSTTWFTYQLLISLKQNVLLINSSGIFENGQKLAENINTTPDAEIIYKHANEFALKHGQNSFLIIETSSIGIDQHRTAFLKPKIGIWTNFSHEHLDYHKTLENYFSAKMKLAKQCEKYFINESINIENKADNIYVYGNELISAKQGTKLEMEFNFNNKFFYAECDVFGRFQAKNILSAIIGLKEFFDIEMIVQHISNLQAPAGRMQLIVSAGRKIFIDNAHKPEALENALKELKNVTKGKLFVIAGCGGDRDKEKRPIMGGIMQALSDIAIITTDNPRNEDPQEIAQEMLSGCIDELTPELTPKLMPEIILDRKKAIMKTLKIMQPNDVLLIAGKGEEEVQIFANNQIIPWNDYAIVKEVLELEILKMEE